MHLIRTPLAWPGVLPRMCDLGISTLWRPSAYTRRGHILAEMRDGTDDADGTGLSDDIVLPNVRRAIMKHTSLPPGSPVLLSVSGGSDSVALFRVILELNIEMRWSLSAVHFNHGLRPEAVAEEEFVNVVAHVHHARVERMRCRTRRDTETPRHARYLQ